MIDNLDKNDNAESILQTGTDSPDTRQYLAYNTSCTPLKMPEYGRLVLQMVEFALTIEKKDERTAYAHKIVRVMGGLNPQMKHVPDYQYKLWDHLAYLSDYKLDIDYPVEIRHYGDNTHPNRLTYPGNKIKLRHYGHLVELLLQKLVEKADTPERNSLILQVADRMRKNLTDWKGDNADDGRIARDISHYTNNLISEEVVLDCLAEMPRTNKRGHRN